MNSAAHPLRTLRRCRKIRQSLTHAASGVGFDCPTSDAACFGTVAVYKVMAGMAIYHAILAIAMIGVTSTRDKRAVIHNGCWLLKALLWVRDERAKHPRQIIDFSFVDWYYNCVLLHRRSLHCQLLHSRPHWCHCVYACGNALARRPCTFVERRLGRQGRRYPVQPCHLSLFYHFVSFSSITVFLSPLSLYFFLPYLFVSSFSSITLFLSPLSLCFFFLLYHFVSFSSLYLSLSCSFFLPRRLRHPGTPLVLWSHHRHAFLLLGCHGSHHHALHSHKQG